MNRIHTLTNALIAGFILTLGAVPGWGGPPPNNDASDTGNTAGGTGALQNNTSGGQNTAFGNYSLLSNNTGTYNAAFGFEALAGNSSGTLNTALGGKALYANSTGGDNTATGFFALGTNSTGNYNTADGFLSLDKNTTGSFNTATGFEALYFNTTASGNTATGASALYNSTAFYNTGTGFKALTNTTTGSQNTATGAYALSGNVAGEANTADGVDALLANSAGNGNTAIGEEALKKCTGSANIGLGLDAGFSLTNGSNNIDIGSIGVAGESSTIRIGSTSQTKTFMAGVSGVNVGGATTVVINSSGQLGTVSSSARYKKDIETMGTRTQDLSKLRPVIFRYKQDEQGELQYGLIAEEVANVYPELVTTNARGQIESVQYQKLIPMLLNEVQHEQEQIGSQGKELAELKAQNANLRNALEQMEAQVAKVVALNAERGEEP